MEDGKPSAPGQLRAWGYFNLRKRTLGLKVGTTLEEKFQYLAEYGENSGLKARRNSEEK